MRPDNFTPFSLPDTLDLGGAGKRYRQNVEALRTILALSERSKDGMSVEDLCYTVTPEERQALCRYTGWGDSAVLRQAFGRAPLAEREQENYLPDVDTVSTSIKRGEDRYKLAPELAELGVTDAMKEAILRSSLNAHYTSLDVIRAMWDVLDHLGIGALPTIKYLDPSCGIGHFLGACPAHLRARIDATQVDLDIISAQIACALYPETYVIRGGFERLHRAESGERVVKDHYDLAITNVPFGQIPVADTGIKPAVARASIHNYFITRMLELVRPGGVVACITSRYSLDGRKTAPICRRQWAHTANLVAAVRLPDNAFKANAGTEVVTDILFFQKRRKGEESRHIVEGWADTGIIKLPYRYTHQAWKQIGTYEYGGVKYGNVTEEVVGSHPIHISRLYLERPDLVLGTHSLDGKMYGDYKAKPSIDMDENRLATFDWKHRKSSAAHEAEADRIERIRIGSYTVKAGDLPIRTAITQALATVAPLDWDASAVSKVNVRDTDRRSREFVPTGDIQSAWFPVYWAAKRVIKAQVTNEPDETIAALQAELHVAYDAAVAATGRVSSRQVTKAFASNTSEHSFLLALEQEDGSKAPLFYGRTIAPRVEATTFENPVDALSACVDRVGKVDVQWIGAHTNLSSQDDVLTALGDRVYLNPETLEYELAEAYLSGDVRRKLRVAEAAFQQRGQHLKPRVDERFRRNIDALKAVQPESLEPAQIQIGLNARWIPTWCIEEFIVHVLNSTDKERNWGLRVVDANDIDVEIVSGNWVIQCPAECRTSSHGAQWSTRRVHAFDLLTHGMNGTAVTVYDTDSDGTRHRNQSETIVAQQKLKDLESEYVRWLWSEEERSGELLDAYNETFNCWVQRSFSGQHITFPGMSSAVSLRPFQFDGVARAIYSDDNNDALFVWETGAGKTYGAIAVVEKRLQLGMSRKALVVVPKNVVPQWAASWRTLFPESADQLLVATKDSLSKKDREVFLARIVTGDYRVVVMSHDQLKRIPVSADLFKKVMQQRVEELEDAIAAKAAAEGKDTPGVRHLQKELDRLTDKIDAAEAEGTVSAVASKKKKGKGKGKQAEEPSESAEMKALVKSKMTFEASIQSLEENTKRDSSRVCTFDDLGFDYIVVDEAQVYKNLQIITKMDRVKGISTSKNQITQDFLMKLRHIQAKGRDVPSDTKGSALFLTATPISNSLSESFTMMYYLQYPELKARGLHYADAFFGAFARPYSSVELEPHCKGHRVVQSLQFGNLRELQLLFRQSAHVVGKDKLNLKLPRLATGSEVVITVPGSQSLRSYIDTLAYRAVRIRQGEVEPEDDNMLVVCHDGRIASLINGAPGTTEIRDTKLDRVVERVLHHYTATQAELGTQLIFCDMGTPKGKDSPSFDATESDDAEAMAIAEALESEGLTEADEVQQTQVYEYVKQQLIRKGISAREIAFLQQFQRDPDALRELFRRFNAGEVRVLLGSVPVGMNLQQRMIALHHIDPVWRPDWKTQRDGRIIRQGNSWEEVYIYLYITESSFDSYMWGLIRRKLHFIYQFLYSDAVSRTIDGDIGEIVLRASEIQAIASGNPLILQHVAAKNELTRLDVVRQAWSRELRESQYLVATFEASKQDYEARIAKWTGVLESVMATPASSSDSDEISPLVVAGREYRSKKEANAALKGWIQSSEAAYCGTYRGAELWRDTYMEDDELTIQVRIAGESRTCKALTYLIDRRIESIPENLRNDAVFGLRALQSRYESAKVRVEQVWEHETTWSELVKRVNELQAQIDEFEKKEKERDAADKQAREQAAAEEKRRQQEEQWREEERQYRKATAMKRLNDTPAQMDRIVATIPAPLRAELSSLTAQRIYAQLELRVYYLQRDEKMGVALAVARSCSFLNDLPEHWFTDPDVYDEQVKEAKRRMMLEPRLLKPYPPNDELRTEVTLDIISILHIVFPGTSTP